MSEICVHKLSKRYGFQWIIKDLDATFLSGSIYGISGSNGSGKTTLVKMLSGYLSPTAGSIIYTLGNEEVPHSEIYRNMSLVGPYTDVIQEFTLKEMFTFHQKFKPLAESLTFGQFEEMTQLKSQSYKFMQHFSSGMKQKVQLALALLSKTEILLLDEPTSFLDTENKNWFKKSLMENSKDRIIIIASNDTFDLDLCPSILHLGKR